VVCVKICESLYVICRCGILLHVDCIRSYCCKCFFPVNDTMHVDQACTWKTGVCRILLFRCVSILAINDDFYDLDEQPDRGYARIPRSEAASSKQDKVCWKHDVYWHLNTDFWSLQVPGHGVVVFVLILNHPPGYMQVFVERDGDGKYPELHCGWRPIKAISTLVHKFSESFLG
jgi:hypothetical protein